jgi:hypothetical protein
LSAGREETFTNRRSAAPTFRIAPAPPQDVVSMETLPMPSDVKGVRGNGAAPAAAADVATEGATEGATTKKELPPLSEPPSARLIVRLFLIPLLIAAGVIAIMVPIGLLSGGYKSVYDAVDELERTTGGARTADVLVGPGSKQRYIAAQYISFEMRRMAERGMSVDERIKLSDRLLKALEQGTHPAEGQIQHFLILALGRAWQVDTRQAAMDSPEAVASRQKILDALTRGGGDRSRPAYIDAAPLETSKEAVKAAADVRKAACLALSFWGGRPEARQAIPVLLRKANDDPDPDVRFAAITALGPLATRDDKEVVETLLKIMRTAGRNETELVWASAGSLAQMNVPESKDVILMLLDRSQLKDLEYYDREKDPDNPRARTLSEEEQQRILINTIECAVKLDVPEVQAKIKSVAESDPSQRVKASALESLGKRGKR